MPSRERFVKDELFTCEFVENLFGADDVQLITIERHLYTVALKVSQQRSGVSVQKVHSGPLGTGCV